MKVNFKITIICMLIILPFLPDVYAYWTDKVNSEVNINFTYDVCLDVLHIPVPEIPVLPVPQELVIETEVDSESSPNTGQNEEVDISDSENTETKKENPDEEVVGEEKHETDESDLNSEDFDAEGTIEEKQDADESDLISENSDDENTIEDKQEVDETDLNSKDFDDESEGISGGNVENNEI